MQKICTLLGYSLNLFTDNEAVGQILEKLINNSISIRKKYGIVPYFEL